MAKCTRETTRLTNRSSCMMRRQAGHSSAIAVAAIHSELAKRQQHQPPHPAWVCIRLGWRDIRDANMLEAVQGHCPITFLAPDTSWHICSSSSSSSSSRRCSILEVSTGARDLLLSMARSTDLLPALAPTTWLQRPSFALPAIRYQCLLEVKCGVTIHTTSTTTYKYEESAWHRCSPLQGCTTQHITQPYTLINQHPLLFCRPPRSSRNTASDRT
jgi:hypothetical protein